MLRGCAPDEHDAPLTLYLQYSVSFGCDDDSFRRFRGFAMRDDEVAIRSELSVCL